MIVTNKRVPRLGAAGVATLLALALGAPAGAWAQSGVTAAADAAAGSGGLSDATKQGIGCLATSGATVVYTTFWAGATESLMIAAGGLLVPSMTPTLWLGLASTVVAATCALGATATPAVLWTIEQKDNIAANLVWQMQQTETGLAGLFTAPATASEPPRMAESTR